MLNKEQHAKIMRVYEQRRTESEMRQLQHKQEVRHKVPGFTDLEKQITDVTMNTTALLIRTADEKERAGIRMELNRQIGALSQKKVDLLTAAGYPSDYLELGYTCSQCRDTGYINGEKCRCFRKMETEILYDSSRLQDILDRNNFSRLDEHYYTGEDLVHFRDAVNTCHRFIDDFSVSYRNILFFGPAGTGKSFLSGCIAKELMDRGHSILYFGAPQLFSTISTALKDSEREETDSLYNGLYHSDLLIIDDLGTEYINDFTNSQLYSIINERILGRKPYIISTNMSLNDLRDAYSERLTSRLMQDTYICRLNCRDIRRQIKMEQGNTP